MNGHIKKENLSGLSRAMRFKNAIGVFAVMICVSGIGTGIGQALGSETSMTSASRADRQTTSVGAGVFTLASTPSPAMADPCLPLLNKIRQPSEPAIDRTRRSAGYSEKMVPAVAIGFALGLRHAPGPAERLKDDISRRSSSDPSAVFADSHALAVASYRRCRSELELRSPGEG